MCGIAGLLNLNGVFPERALTEVAERMANKMAHRGPDDWGVWADQTGYCALSQRRLSIIDLSPAGHQPMVFRNGFAAITFNGEIYNYEEVREELKNAGCTFTTRTDTEVLLQALLTWGENALTKFDGMFAFGFYRSDTQELMLGRDPFGEKPLYYSQHPDFFAFASELHSLPLVPGFDTTIDEDAIGEYFMLQYVQAPRTIYRSARKLPPGHFLKIDRGGKATINQYFKFTPQSEEYRDRPLADLADELGHLLIKSVKRRMISDVPLGAFISGGVDSSTVVAIMAKELGAEVKSFSIGFQGTADSEHHNARQMAEYLGCAHHEQVLDPDILSLATMIGEILDEPNGDSSCLPTYLISDFARRYVTVALSGDGADEMFGGYGRYFNVLETDIRQRAGDKNVPAHWKPGDSYLNGGVAVYSEEALGELMGYVPKGTHERMEAFRAVLNDDPRPLLTRMRDLDTCSYMPGAVLAKVDRMSMQHALEVRCPFLNVEIARFAEKLSSDQCYKNGQGKLVLKELASRYIPRDWLERPKQGFGLPMSQWGREELLRVTSELCLQPSGMTANWFGSANIRNFLTQQSDPGRFSTYKVWHLLIFEVWLRSHRVIKAPSRADLIAGQTESSAFDPVVLDLQNIRPPRDGKLHPSNAALLSHLQEDLNLQVLVFADSEIPQEIEDLETCAAVVCRRLPYGVRNSSRFHLHNWLENPFWSETFPLFVQAVDAAGSGRNDSTPAVNRSARKRVAVICAPLTKIPPEGFLTLLRLGFSKLIHLEGSDWVVNRLLEPRKDLLFRVYERGVRIFARIEYKLRRALARRIVRYFSRELPLYYRHDTGHCYRARIPGLGRNIKRIEKQPADLLVFEGETLLLSGFPPNDVRAFGGGRSAVLESDILFSSLDGSYPGDNSRTYSYIYCPRLVSLARKFGITPEFLFFNLKRDSRPLALRPQTSLVRLIQEKRLQPVNQPFETFTQKNSSRRLLPQPARSGESGDIMLYTGYLYAGGAERQLCYLAEHLKQRGYPVRVMTYFDCDKNSFHYYPLLLRAGVPLDLVYRSEPHPKFSLAPLINPNGIEILSWINMLPRELAEEVWSLFTHLIVTRPKVLHCWLDQPNITGAIAGWLAGVPKVVLSTRNVNPTNFPYLNVPWYRHWYQILAQFPNVVLSGNSLAGIESYADWIGIPASRFSLIHNGLNLNVIESATPAMVDGFRAEFGLESSTPVVVGIFRLSEEKRPLLFLKIIKELQRTIPDIRAFVAGIGSMEKQFMSEISRLGLENTVTYLGRRDDVPVVIQAANLLLLTSSNEGLPNVLMEAQYLERPVVCTRAGGSAELVVEGKTGFILEQDDFRGMVKRCTEILTDPELARRMGAAARLHIAENFSVDKMVSKTIEVYGVEKPSTRENRGPDSGRANPHTDIAAERFVSNL